MGSFRLYPDGCRRGEVTGSLGTWCVKGGSRGSSDPLSGSKGGTSFASHRKAPPEALLLEVSPEK